MRIGIGNDHSALELKAEIIEFLKEKGHEVVDFGTDSSESCDYPKYGEAVGRAVVAKEVDCGILIWEYLLQQTRSKECVQQFAASRLQRRCPEHTITVMCLHLAQEW